MERTKILYGNDRVDQVAATNNVSRSRFVFLLKSRDLLFLLFYRGNLQLPITPQLQSQLSDNKQLTTTEPLTDEITPTRPDISYP
jgi:hypothetical protein